VVLTKFECLQIRGKWLKVFGIYLLVKAYPDKFTTPGPEKKQSARKINF